MEIQRIEFNNEECVNKFVSQSVTYYPINNVVCDYEFIYWKYVLRPERSFLVTLRHEGKCIFRFVQIEKKSDNQKKIYQIQDFLCTDLKYTRYALFAINNFSLGGHDCFHVSNENSNKIYNRPGLGFRHSHSPSYPW